MGGRFEDVGARIGRLVEVKNKAYGSAFAKSGDILKILYPDGVAPEGYVHMLLVVRIIDKMFRIANDPRAFGESPFQDITGYGILGVVYDEMRREVDAEGQPRSNGEDHGSRECPDPGAGLVESQ